MSRVHTALLPLLLSGCFAVNDPSAHEPLPVEADEFCAVLSALVCGALECGTCPPRAGTPEEIRAFCETNYSSFCRQSYGPLIADARTGYEPEAMAVQLATGRLLLQQCDEMFWDWVSRGDGLLAGFTGSVPTGGSCDPQFVETENRRDDPRYLACEGTDVCLPAATGWRCQSTLAEGAPCYAGQCDPGLTCVGHSAFDDTQRGVCGTQKAAAGEPCNEASDCASSSCQFYLNDGRCLDVDQAYCGLRSTCDASRFFLGSDSSGPILEGGECESVAQCSTSEQASTIDDCRRVRPPPAVGEPDMRQPLDQICEGFEVVCSRPQGVLDAQARDRLCALSRLDPQPVVYCGPPLE